MLNELADLSSTIDTPQDYFLGYEQSALIIPKRVLLFSRQTTTTLRQRSLEYKSHHRFVLVIPIQTNGEINLDHAVFKLSLEHALLVFPFQFHFYGKLDHEQLNWLFITFEGVKATDIHVLRDRRLHLDELSQNLLLEVPKLWKNRDKPNVPAHIQLTLSKFLYQLIATHTHSNREQPKPEPKNLISKVNAWIFDKGPGAKTIEALSKSVGICPSTLRKQFKSTSGVTLGRYLREQQLLHATSLLSDSQLPIGEIALRCGYESSASFSRAFRHQSGENPRKYRSRFSQASMAKI
jgi:AraC-like DNA-binding protein